jgi:hypothetical protein
MCVLAVVAVVGSALVLLSFLRDKRLRNVHGIYLANLAVCDLVIGAFSIPLYLVYVGMSKDLLCLPLCYHCFYNCSILVIPLYLVYVGMSTILLSLFL